MKNRLLVFGLLLAIAPLIAIAPEQQQLASRLVYLLLRGDQKQIEKLYKNPTPGFTQSDGHAFVHYKDIMSYFSKDGIYGTFLTLHQTTDAQRCFGALYQKELEETSAGRYTFVHAQRWVWEWISTLYQTLYETATNTTIQNYRFLRFNRLNKFGKNEDSLYNQLKKADHWDDKRYLFMNHSLFGNTKNQGECSAGYWHRGHDYSCEKSKKFANEKLFNKFNLDKIYKKYQKELDLLQQEHAKLTTYGNLLLLSLSPKCCQENVIEAVQAWGQSTTDTATKTLTQLRTNPTAVTNCDSYVYRLILTRSRTLKPSDDIKIFAFNGVEPAKWAAFCKKRTELFERIKKDVRATLKRT